MAGGIATFPFLFLFDLIAPPCEPASASGIVMQTILWAGMGAVVLPPFFAEGTWRRMVVTLVLGAFVYLAVGVGLIIGTFSTGQLKLGC